jgi:hypothetical protein
LQVLFGDREATVVDVSDRRIDAVVPVGLRAGVNTVRILQPVDAGPDRSPGHHLGAESNAAVFMLAPSIFFPPAPPGADPLPVARGGTLAVHVDPPVEPRQQVFLLLGARALRRSAAVGEPVTTADLDFVIPGEVAPGRHLVRLRVDGAESALVVDDDRTSATFNRYVAPEVEVT